MGGLITADKLGLTEAQAESALERFKAAYPGIEALNRFDDQENERRMTLFLASCSGDHGVLMQDPKDPDEEEEGEEEVDDEEWDDEDDEEDDVLGDDEDDNDLEDEEDE